MKVTIKNGRQSTIMEEVEEIVDVELYGNDECFDENGFYQLADIDGTTYKIYYSTTDEGGNDIPLDCIDYSNALNIETNDPE